MNMSTSECSSGCESGWTAYLDQSTFSVDRYASEKNHWRDKEGEEEEEEVEEEKEEEEEEEGNDIDDEDLSMVSDASSGPRHIHDDEEGSAYYSYSISVSQEVKMRNRKKNLKEKGVREKQQQDAYLDDTASSPVFSISKKNLALPTNQASMEKETQGFSSTYVKGKSSLK